LPPPIAAGSGCGGCHSRLETAIPEELAGNKLNKFAAEFLLSDKANVQFIY
jgi:hypothetical protein